MAPITPVDHAEVRTQPEIPWALTFDGVTKTFGAQTAVDGVSFSIAVGEIHALVGENGAGKSTLIKILAGEYKQDSGTIVLRGEELPIGHPWERRDLGLAFIHQEPALFPAMSITENILLGEGFRDTRLSTIPWRTQYAVARDALAKVGLDVDPRGRLDALNIAERQLVAVAAVLLRKQRVVVFDEPTACLTETETNRLFALIREMRNDGVSVLYVSHRMEEIFALADRVTVIKDGRYVTTRPIRELTQKALAELIIGEELEGRFGAPATDRPLGDIVLKVRDLTDRLVHGISFDLREGEILGLAGLAGAGRSNVLLNLFGATDATGSIIFRGETLRLKHPADAIARGIVMVTEERKFDGFIPSFSIWQTITLPWLSKFARFGWLNLRQERRMATQAMADFDVRAASPSTEVRDLSGGNQQKTILARWLSGDINLVLLDEPTHGVDIGAKDEIYQIIKAIAARGVPVIVVSSELEELEGLCDRVVMLVRGLIVGELTGAEINKTQMLRVLLSDLNEGNSHAN